MLQLNHLKKQRLLLSVILIVVAWAVIILPSAYNAQWGHLDDGVGLLRAQEGLLSSFIFSYGRIYPVYLVHNWFMYQVGGLNPRVWYLIQSTEVLAVLLLVYFCLYFLTNKSSIGVLASLLFITSSPTAESYYTISKAEPILTLLYALGLFLLSYWISKGDSKKRNFPFFLSALAIAFLMIFTKETGLLFILICVPSFIYSIFEKKYASPQLVIPIRSYFSVFLVTSSIWMALKIYVSTTTADDYTRFKPMEAAYWNYLHYVTQTPDVLVLIALALVLLLFIALRSSKSVLLANSDLRIAFLLSAGLLSTCLAYLIILLAWNQGHSYYMLPVSLISSITLALLIWLYGTVPHRKKHILLIAVSTIIVISRLFSLPFLYNMATIQRNADRIEASVRLELEQMKLLKGRLVDMDWQSFEEPVIQNTLLLETFNKSNNIIKWVGGEGFIETYKNERGDYGNTKSHNAFADVPLNENDHLLFSRATSPPKMAFRGIRFFSNEDMLIKVRLIENRTGLKLKEIKKWQIEMPIFHPWSLRKQTLTYAKHLYSFDLSAPPLSATFSWKGVYPDNYTGETAVLSMSSRNISVDNLKLSINQTPEILSRILPLYVELIAENQKTDVILTNDIREKLVALSSILPKGKGDIIIKVKNPWIPQNVNPKSLDGRLLGVEVRYLRGFQQNDR